MESNDKLKDDKLKQEKEAQEQEAYENLLAFEKLMQDKKISAEHLGKAALMKNREIKGYYTNWKDAYQAGMLAFKDKVFSVHEVRTTAINLGYYSYAIL